MDRSNKPLPTGRVKDLLNNLPRQGDDRKRSLDSLPPKSIQSTTPPPIVPPSSIYGIPMGLLNRGDADKARKIAQLQVLTFVSITYR